jgi:ketosteroid isomerase-like protein
VQTYLQKVGEQDVDGIVALFADDIDWLVPGDPALPWIGARHRRDELADYFRTLWSHFVAGQSRVELGKIVIDGPDAVVLASFDHVVARNGRPFHTEVAMHVTVADGRITVMHLYEDTHIVSQAMAA